MQKGDVMKDQLINQVSERPTRKVMGATVGGTVAGAGGGVALLAMMAAGVISDNAAVSEAMAKLGWDEAALAGVLVGVVSGLGSFVVGYMRRERA